MTAAPPHCDSSILHAPGACEYCDACPEWQEYRRLARIAFTGAPDELGEKPDYTSRDPRAGVSPCPSTWFRSPRQRDRWPGNVPETPELATARAVYARVEEMLREARIEGPPGLSSDLRPGDISDVPVAFKRSYLAFRDEPAVMLPRSSIFTRILIFLRILK